VIEQLFPIYPPFGINSVTKALQRSYFFFVLVAVFFVFVAAFFFAAAIEVLTPFPHEGLSHR
jgi:uncharacterized protein involved in exopolysaccharide biosynthesis